MKSSIDQTDVAASARVSISPRPVQKPDPWGIAFESQIGSPSISVRKSTSVTQLFARRHVAGAVPNALLKARENAASDS
jgi:hypothetical protein